jgi:site-specific DNA-methyltransferase (adenine-specific)
MDVMLTNLKDIQLVHSDCLEFMASLSDCTVDMTLTSPPYDNLRDYGNKPFCFERVAAELYRVTKEGGVLIWVVGDATIKGSETGTSFKQAIYFKDIGFKLHDTMIYAKRNPMPSAGDRYHQCFEYMFCLSKGQPKTFNPIQVESKYSGIANMKNRGKDGSLRYTQKRRTATHKVGNIFTYSVGGGISTKDKIAYQHPAIFPENLVYDQILTWSNSGDLVCDPMFGSGTVPKMCLLMGRRFMGSEIEQHYYQIAKERITATGQYLSSPTAIENILS